MLHTRTLRVAFCCVAAAAACFGQALFPAPGQDLQPPQNAPAAPGTPFAATFRGILSPDAPAIAAWNESARPDESLTVTGVRLTLQSGPAAGSDTRVWISAGGAPVEAHVVRARATVLTVTLPSAVEYGMYLMWIANSAGVSSPVALNRTNPQWIGPLGHVAQPGSLKRVFGKDLSTGHSTSSSNVYLRAAAGGSFVQARVTSVEPYAVEFQVPPQLAPGNYSVYVHNGHGGAVGWGAPLPLQVTAAWTRGTGMVRVAPSGGPDDSAAIQSALEAQSALSSGGTVQLTEGVYRVARELTVPRNVRLMGAGKDRTHLEVRLASADEGVICIGGDRAEVRGIDFNLISDGKSLAPNKSILRGAGPYLHTWEDIAIADIRLRVTGPGTGTWGRWNGLLARRIEIADSEFFREVNLTQSDYWVHGNVFHGGAYMGPGAGTEGALNLQGLQRLVLEKNHFETPVLTDWTRPGAVGMNIARRVLYSGLGVASVLNLYIAHNTSDKVLTENEGNKGEMLLFHGGGAPWYGQVVSAAGKTLTVRAEPPLDPKSGPQNYGAHSYSGALADPLTQIDGAKHPVVVPENNAFGQVGMFVAVVNGAGMGQLQRVTGVTPNTISIAGTWRVAPDATSSVVLTYVYKDIVIYANDLTAYPPGVWGRSSASAFLQFGGDSWSNVVDGNISHRTFTGARVAASPLTQSWWNEIQDNQFLELRHAGVEVTLWGTYTDVALVGPATLGNVFRNNRIQITGPQRPAAQPDWVYQLGSIGGNWTGAPIRAAFPYHESNIFENTRGTGGRIGILAGDWADTLYRRNNITVDRSTTERSSPAFTPTPIVTRPQAQAIAVDNTYAVQQ